MALCLPAKFQVFIVIVNVLITFYSITGILGLSLSLIFTGFFGYVWILFLNCMCNNGYRWLSWLLIMLGLVLNIIGWILLYNLKKNGKLDVPTAAPAAPAAPAPPAAPAVATTPPAAPAVPTPAATPSSLVKH